jgi:hypothetical protein
MNIQEVLTYLRPGEEWLMVGDDYEGLTWLSSTEKPTLEEINNAYPDAAKVKEDEQAVKEEARESALAKLTALGLTAKEIQALVG